MSNPQPPKVHTEAEARAVCEIIGWKIDYCRCGCGSVKIITGFCHLAGIGYLVQALNNLLTCYVLNSRQRESIQAKLAELRRKEASREK